MEDVEKRLDLIKSKINSLKAPQDVKIVAVSKKKSWQEITLAYNNGVRDIGENYLQEFLSKKDYLKDLNITWHYVGQIQSKKCKEIAENFEWIHTIDRIKVANLLEKYCPEGKKIKGLIQINIDDEDSKSGINLDELNSFLENISSMKKILICGFMIIPKPEKDIENLKQTFNLTKNLLVKLSQKYKNLSEISMGMSRDYELAIKEGSTIVRLGESIFGARNK